MTTANKITITRILLIPFFVMMVIYYGQSMRNGEPQPWMRYAAILFFLVAAASDGIDGYIARRFNQRSKLGLILDPIADKGLLLSAIIVLSISNWNYEFPIWFPVLVITRDIVIVAGVLTLHYLNGSVHVAPSWLGKIATVLQMTAISFVLLQLNFFTKIIPIGNWKFHLDFLDLPVALAGLFTLLSGIGYTMNGLRQLHTHGHANAR